MENYYDLGMQFEAREIRKDAEFPVETIGLAPWLIFPLMAGALNGYNSTLKPIFIIGRIKIYRMAKSRKSIIIPDELLLSKIYFIRSQKVMLDEDLARLYQVETKRLNEQVKRNLLRFPADFMFQLSRKEFEHLKSQNATSSWGGRRKLPMAFTEQGVAMLSSVLNSETAIKMNIRIIRIFTKMREVLLTHKDILLQLEKMETKLGVHDEEISVLFGYLKQLLEPPATPRRKIGFRRKDEEPE